MFDHCKIHIFCETEKGIYLSGNLGRIYIDGNSRFGFVVEYANDVSDPFITPYSIDSVEAEEKLLNTLILRSAKRRVNEKMDLLG